MILVTGGCGFIGSHVVDRLIKDGHEVIIVDNLSTGKIENLNPNAVFHQGDIADPQSFYPLDQDIDTVYHLAALARIQPSFKQPTLTYQSNCVGTINVLEFARKKNAKVVFAGSSSAYHDIYANPYTYTKYVGEEHCKLYNRVYGLPVGIARFFNVYGPRQIDEGAYATVIGIFERQKREGRPLTITGTGEKRRDFTHVHDIIDGLIRLADYTKKGRVLQEVFQLGTGKNYSIKEVATLFGGPIEFIPPRPGEADITLAQITLSKINLGYKPQFDLRTYIAATKS